MKSQWAFYDRAGRRVVVELEQDDDALKRLLMLLADQAANNKSGRASFGHGALKVRVISREDPRQTELFE